MTLTFFNVKIRITLWAFCFVMELVENCSNGKAGKIPEYPPLLAVHLGPHWDTVGAGLPAHAQSIQWAITFVRRNT